MLITHIIIGIAGMNLEIEGILGDLERDGVVVIKNEIAEDILEVFKNRYMSSWEEIKCDWPFLEFKRRKYYDESITPMNYIGQDLYKDHKIAQYHNNTEIIDMGNKRYDFTYGMNNRNLPLPSKKLEVIMKSVLKFEYNYYFGGLPVEKNTVSNRQGFWHRDAYSLFGDEAVDIKIPPWYFTVLFSFEDSPVEFGTEFILGTHKTNFKALGITNQEELSNWCKENQELSKIVSINKGDICILNGLTLHRGRNNISGNSESSGIDSGIDRGRHMLYSVFTKNWYDEDTALNHYYE